jgi:hypothetical protein
MPNSSQVLPATEVGVEPRGFLVIHPLDDHPEEKVRSDHLPPLAMTLSVRLSLFTLRAYLLLMMLLLLYHVVDLAGLITHHK